MAAPTCCRGCAPCASASWDGTTRAGARRWPPTWPWSPGITACPARTAWSVPVPEPLILAIDNGTQSVRALLFDLHGELVAKSQVHLQAYYSDHPGWAEHSAEGYWQAVGIACQRLWSGDAGLRERVAAVAVTTQRGTVVNVDADGKPLRPAITWLDQRKTERCRRWDHGGAPRSGWPGWPTPSPISSARPRSTGLPRASPTCGGARTSSCCCRAT